MNKKNQLFLILLFSCVIQSFAMEKDDSYEYVAADQSDESNSGFDDIHEHKKMKKITVPTVDQIPAKIMVIPMQGTWYKCSSCMHIKTTQTKGNIERHMRNAHSPGDGALITKIINGQTIYLQPNGQGYAYTCNICQNSFSTSVRYNAHLKNVHADKAVEKKRKEAMKKPRVYCDICNRSIIKGNFDDHLATQLHQNKSRAIQVALQREQADLKMQTLVPAAASSSASSITIPLEDLFEPGFFNSDEVDNP